jgi:tetratricopeptide (TPR) repeat protein/TolB-like protein
LPGEASAQSVRVRSVLLLPFQESGEASGGGWVGEGAAELLTLAFSTHPAFSPINRARLSRLGVQGAVGERDAVAAGRALRADLVLFGAVERAGSGWAIRPRLVEFRGGSSEGRDLGPVSRAEGQFAELLGDTALAYMSRLGVPVSADEARRIRKASNPTTEWQALEAFVRGRRMFLAETPPGNEGAAELFARAVEIDPNFAIAHFYLGASQLRLGNRWKAQAQFRAAVQVDPSVPEPYKALGDLFMSSPRRLHDQAIEAYQKALEARPFFADAYVGIGDARAAKGQVDRAITDYQKALTYQPLNPRVYQSLGKIYYAEKGLYYESVEAYKKAIDLDPVFVDARMGLGEVYEDKGLYAEAAEEYKKVVDLDPKHTGALYNVALVYEKVDPKEALDRWERYIQVASQIPSEKDGVDFARQHIRKLRRQLEKGN